MLLLFRTTLKESLKHSKQHSTFPLKQFLTHEAVSLKCLPRAYFVKAKCVFPVKPLEIVRSCSSFTLQRSDQNSDESTTPSENELEVDMNALTEGDPVLEKRVKILLLEREVMRQEGFRVPSHMKTAEWKELLKLPTRTSRKKYLNFLFLVEKKKDNRKRKKEEKQSSGENEESVFERCDTSDHITYGFRGSTIFLRIYDSTMNNFYNYNAIRAMVFGQKLVFDCTYDRFMTLRESQNCAKQLMMAFADNRLHSEPFDLYLTGGPVDCRTLSCLHKYIPTLYEDTFPLTVTEKSYLDLFPREKLVYLTPHCRDELLEYDHDAVYIVGSMVDKVNNEPLSLAKAKREGLKMAKLPLDRYLNWGSGGGKSLTLNQVLKILLDQKGTGDWRKSLKHVPQRKLVRENTLVKPFKRHFMHKGINMKT